MNLEFVPSFVICPCERITPGVITPSTGIISTGSCNTMTRIHQRYWDLRVFLQCISIRPSARRTRLCLVWICLLHYRQYYIRLTTQHIASRGWNGVAWRSATDDVHLSLNLRLPSPYPPPPPPLAPQGRNVYCVSWHEEIEGVCEKRGPRQEKDEMFGRHC